MPADDSSKHALAVTEKEIENGERLRRESREALRAFRDSSAEIPDFDPPTIIVHNHIRDRSIKPPQSPPEKKDSWNPSTVRGRVFKYVLLGLAIASGLAAGLIQALGK
jgi:hypothetical protein